MARFSDAQLIELSERKAKAEHARLTTVTIVHPQHGECTASLDQVAHFKAHGWKVKEDGEETQTETDTTKANSKKK